jgi:hypothetical protein
MSAVAKIKDDAEATVETKGRGVAKLKPAAVPDVPKSDFDKILALAENPDVQIERIEKVIDLFKSVQADNARRAYDAAFAEMQPSLPIIEKKGTIKTNEKDENKNKTGRQVAMAKYAKFEDIIEGIADTLKQYGFALSFKIAQPTPDRVSVTCTLSHREGHREETTFALPIDTSGAKNNVQGWGSSVSYAKRYTACALLNIAARGEDDDGRSAENGGFISDEQADELLRLIQESGSNPASFLKIARAENVSEILAKDFAGLKKVLEAKKHNGTAAQ